VLLLDEPLSALDAKVRATLRDEIRRIQSELHITTLFVTHDQEEALSISDRIGVMSNGRLEQLGTPREVYRHPSNAFVARFVGSMNELPAEVAGPDAVRVGGTIVATAAATDRPVGATVNLLVRPEDMHIVDEDTGLPGTVATCTFQGASTVLGVRLDALDLLVAVHVPGVADPTPGERVDVGIDGARAVSEPRDVTADEPAPEVRSRSEGDHHDD
jgi:putative spermidine/putrescine transport system ATP-binding protein